MANVYSVVMLSLVVLNVVMLSVVTPAYILTLKYKTRVEVPGSNNHISSQYSISNYDSKMFENTYHQGPIL
jgi:hypothetical protein